MVSARDRGKGKENSFPGLLRDTDDDDDGDDDNDGTYSTYKVNLFSINFIFNLIFIFLQLDRDIKALKFDLNVTDVTLQSSVSALLFDVNHVNQTLKDQVCRENSLNAPQDVKLTIYVNHPGGNLVHKLDKTIKFDSVELQGISKSAQITAEISLSFPPQNGANHLFFQSQFPVFQCKW